MTKSELIDTLAERRAIPKKIAEEVVGSVFDQLTSALAAGTRVEIRGFGSFKVRDYRSYIGRNPRTGNEILVQPKRLPVFKVSKMLHNRLNEGLDG